MKKWQLSTHGADPGKSPHVHPLTPLIQKKKEKQNDAADGKQADKYPFLYVQGDSCERHHKLTSRIYKLLVAHKQDSNQTKESVQC